MTDSRVHILDKTVCYDGFFRIERYRLRHQLFRGGWSREITRELFERGHAAAVLPYDPLLDAVVLIEQFRIGALETPGDPWLLEIVAGVIDKPDETPEDVVRREAVEEANCVIQDIVHICDYFVSPGGTSECISLFCGKVDAAGVGGVWWSRGRGGRYPRHRRAFSRGTRTVASRQHQVSRAHYCAAMAATQPRSPPDALGSDGISNPARLLSTGHGGVLSPLCLQGQGNDDAGLAQELPQSRRRLHEICPVYVSSCAKLSSCPLGSVRWKYRSPQVPFCGGLGV